MADGQVIIEVGADTKAFDKQIAQVEKELQELQNQDKNFILGKNKGKEKEYEQLKEKIQKTTEKLMILKAQRDKLNQEPPQEFNNSLTDTGNKISDIIRRVGRWALAVFSVRTAYNLVSRASSTLAQYNEQYATNLEYIRFALAQALAPVLEYVVNLARTLLAYVNYIAQAWFGVNLFANASADSFAKAKKNIAGANASAKELQKTLTGFDEMNILNSTSTGGGGGVGGLLPSFDLSSIQDIEIPNWIKWIADNKDIVLGAITAIVGAFLAFKALEIAGTLNNIIGGFIKLTSTMTAFSTMLLGIGIAVIFIGIAQAIKGVIDYINNPSWSSFREILYGLEVAFGGLAVAILAVNATNPVGWIIIAIDAVAILATKIADLVNEEEDEEEIESNILSIERELKQAKDELTKANNAYISAVENAEKAEKELKEAQEQTGITIDSLLTKMERENKTYKDLDESERKVYKAYMNNKGAQETLINTTNEQAKATENEKEKVFELIGTLGLGMHSFEDYKTEIVNAYEEGSLSAEQASFAIVHAMEEMDDETKKTFTQDLPNNIKEGLNPSRYTSWSNSFKSWWNNSLMANLNKTFYLTANLMKGTGFSTGGYVTKLATGGLINLPSKGVPVSNAIAGEARNRAE